jgi:hypothetical protein
VDMDAAHGKPYARVRFCPECRLAESAWRFERDSTPQSAGRGG